jgi:uridine phosphorylase
MLTPSELITNPDGSIYHLHLHPDQVATTLLTVGDPGRVEKVSQHFDRVEHRVAKREFVTHTGELNGKRLTVISTGIGPDNIDIVINELDALFNIDLNTRTPKAQLTQLDIIRVGTSGAIQPDLPIGQIVASSYGAGLDNLMNFYDWRHQLDEADMLDALREFLQEQGHLPVRPYLFGGSRQLLEQWTDEHTRRGITLTSPGFYAPQGRQLRAASLMQAQTISQLQAFEHAGQRILNFEMETSAIYGLCRMLGHRALSYSVILANRARQEFSKNPDAEVDRLIRHVLDKL